MEKKTLGIILLVGGIIVAAISATADWIGLGEVLVFGYKQIIGTVAGVIAFVAGLVLTLRQ
jgi:hypothetical protein